MRILNQNLLTLDFWQDKVTYGSRTNRHPRMRRTQKQKGKRQT